MFCIFGDNGITLFPHGQSTCSYTSEGAQNGVLHGKAAFGKMLC